MSNVIHLPYRGLSQALPQTPDEWKVRYLQLIEIYGHLMANGQKEEGQKTIQDLLALKRDMPPEVWDELKAKTVTSEDVADVLKTGWELLKAVLKIAERMK